MLPKERTKNEERRDAEELDRFSFAMEVAVLELANVNITAGEPVGALTVGLAVLELASIRQVGLTGTEAQIEELRLVDPDGNLTLHHGTTRDGRQEKRQNVRRSITWI